MAYVRSAEECTDHRLWSANPKIASRAFIEHFQRMGDDSDRYIPDKVVNEALLADKNKIIQRLSSRLKQFIGSEANALLDVNSFQCDGDPCREKMSPSSYVFGELKGMKNLFYQIPQSLTKCSCQDYLGDVLPNCSCKRISENGFSSNICFNGSGEEDNERHRLLLKINLLQEQLNHYSKNCGGGQNYDFIAMQIYRDQFNREKINNYYNNQRLLVGMEIADKKLKTNKSFWTMFF
ncbi:uncharacterized protein LOC126841991 [Adelges cooleyi]|uniref:uncharacterized protein LOC126841991 n=1 Tax=Adelges cooleyi TaxID=133065 RepID=UPI00217F4B2A|nr:uncharacterized protein LOC126841991 [Adelges cooleyi]